MDAWVRLKVWRRFTALMGCWGARSDCKRQTVLTGKSLTHYLVCLWKSGKVRQKLSLHVLYILSDKGVWKRQAEIHHARL